MRHSVNRKAMAKRRAQKPNPLDSINDEHLEGETFEEYVAKVQEQYDAIEQGPLRHTKGQWAEQETYDPNMGSN